jgi:NAD(P)-dependent dehydrogenase (short-subunit alcohol dehydrogenase family)
MKKFLKNNYNFNNRNIIITGGLGSLGLKLSKLFYDSGANIIITDKYEQSSVRNKLKIFTNKKKFTYVKCDLSLMEERNFFYKNVKKKLKKIDILINNAALTGDSLGKSSKNFLSQNSDLWHKEIDVNLVSVIEIIQNFRKLLMISKKPSVINIASIYGFTAPKFKIYKNSKFSSPIGYSVSKSGLIQLTKWFASFLSPKIRVNCISPGGILRKQNKNFIKNYSNETLLKRMATEDDVIGGIVFFASESSQYITGHNLIIDGGWSI